MRAEYEFSKMKRRRNPYVKLLKELEHDPRFVRRIEGARKSLQQGRGVRFENVDWS